MCKKSHIEEGVVLPTDIVYWERGTLCAALPIRNCHFSMLIQPIELSFPEMH